MTKEADVDALLGESTDTPKKAKKTAPAKEAASKAKPAAKKVAKEAAAPAKKTAPAKEPKAEKTAKPKAAKEPIHFAEGERDEMYKRIKQLVRKPINSRELAEKLNVPTRKLRPVLYSLQSKGVVALELGSSRVAGMTVSPAAKAA